VNRIFVEGRVHVRRRMCSTCIFGPRSPVDDERVAEMIEQCGDEGAVPCHHHLGDEVEPVCAGFVEHAGNLPLRLAHALDVVTLVDGDPWLD